MTGLQRLRNVANAMRGYTVHGGGPLDLELMGIADQIERETAHDPSKDVSMSAYDLLPDCDREAISLALDCGGAEEIKKRLMPEGMIWPRFEDGEPVRLGEHWEEDGFDESVTRIDSIEFADDGVRFENEYNEVFCRYGERVKRPAPKVLDADGVEIRVGDTVYLLPGEWCDRFPLLRCHEWDAMKVLSLRPNHNTGRIECRTSPGSVVCYPYPSQLTHRAPVLAADGKPLREGETVWGVDSGTRYTVEKITDELIPIKCRSEMGSTVSLCPSQLTHQRPDSWERLEEDAGKNPFGYCKDVGHRLDTCENSEAYKARDLVRRAKKLAGVER